MYVIDNFEQFGQSILIFPHYYMMDFLIEKQLKEEKNKKENVIQLNISEENKKIEKKKDHEEEGSITIDIL